MTPTDADRVGAGRSLRRVAARGTIINGTFIALVQVLGMSRGLLMAGFLTTREYGVWGVLSALLATMLILKQIGIGEQFVQQDEDDQELEFQRAFTLDLIAGLAFAAVGLVLLAVMRFAYGLPDIVGPGLVLLTILPLVALQLPLAIFYRRMEFGRQRTLQAAEPLVAFAVTIGLAIAGVGYWSLVAGGVAGAAVSAALAVHASPYRLRLRFDAERARSYRGFSWPILLAGGGALVMAQGLTAVGNAKLGLSGLGIVVVTAQISQFADRADRAITDTLYPAICAVKDNVALLYEAFLKSNRLVLVWSLPFGAGVALFAHDLLVGVFGTRWEPGVGLLRATAITLAVHQIGFNWDAFYRARADTRPIAVAAVAGIATTGLFVLPLLAWKGFAGLAAGIALAEAVNLLVRGHYLRRLFPDLSFTRHIVRAVLPTLPAVAAVLLVRLVDGSGRPAGIVAAELALYAGVTALFTWRLERSLLVEMTTYLRRPLPS